MKRVLWILIPLLLTSCIKDLEQEGVYTEGTVKGRVLERTSQQPIGGLTVKLVCNDATLNTTSTANDGTFSLKLEAERQADGCKVVVSADSLYVGCSADVPNGGYGRQEYDLGVLYVDGPGLPIVHTNAVPNDAVSATSVTLTGTVADDLRSTITSRGFAYSTLQYPTLADGSVSVGGALGDFSATVSGLQPGKTYYVRAYATNGVGTAYGEQQSFTTPSGLPTVTTTTATNITANSAVCGGNVTSDGGYSVIQRGVCYSTTPNPTIGGMRTTDGSGTGSFVSNLTGLTAGTTYYYRAYATNATGTVYGEERTMVTAAQ